MQTPILLHKNYTLNEEGYQLKLPLNLETIIPVDDSVRLLSQFVEAMDLTDLYSTYERLTLPTAKAGGFLLQPLLHWLIPFGISMSYTVSTS